MTAQSELGSVVEIAPPPVAEASRLRVVDFPGDVAAPVLERMPLEVRSYPGATAVLVPSKRGGSKNIGAAYAADGTLIEETQRAKPRRNWWPSPIQMPPGPRPAVHLEGRTVYAGRYVTHFGHIMLETMTRLWPDVDYHAYDHLLTIPKFVDQSWTGQRSVLFDQMVSLAGAPTDRVTVAVERVLCDELLVPSSPFRVAVAADPRFLDVFDRIGDHVEREVYRSDLGHLPRRIYLSRSKVDKRRVKGQRSADNEPAAEALFARNGFEIIHPQTLPLTEQVALCRYADVLAGCDGSALHLAMFSRPGARMLAVDSRVVPNQFLIDQARGLDAVHLWAGTQESERRVTSWTIDLPRVAGALDLLLGGAG